MVRTLHLLLGIVLIAIAVLSVYGYKRADAAVPREFLEGLGLEVARLIKKTSFTVPPISDYPWEQLNVLQRDIGSDLKPYEGKDATSYVFLLRNHPLEAVYRGRANFTANVWVVDGKVIGGTLYPIGKYRDEGYMGLGYSLKGKTLEEVTGQTWGEWLKSHP